MLLTVLLSTAGSGLTLAENWPAWRGPRGDGTSAEAGVPVKWDGTTGENITWKVPVPGTGHSSPIVWGDRIFLVTCLEDTQQRILICLNRADGSEIWRCVVTESLLETKHQLNSYASGTPATDGQTVYVSFLITDGTEVPAQNVGKARPVTTGQMLVAAYDFAGNELWKVIPGTFTSVHGFCSSPVIYKDLLIVNGDHDGDSYIVGLNRKTGETAWRQAREHKTRSYCTPLLRHIAGRDQLVFSGSKRIVSLDPATGESNWLIEGPTEQFVASMVDDGEKFYMTAGFPTHHVMGIRADGSGDVTDTHVAWHSEKAKCYVPSPVLVGQQLFVADDRGTVNCFDTASGERLWQDRLGKHYSASLITAGGLVYFLADDGITSVVRPGAALDVVQTNPLGEYAFASPAISDGQLFIRGEHHLFAIGQRQE
ncbi:MAG: PQQ-binding-like beta-propeller repeat protein [Planctomycetaceae bacterium]|nr:PQQ-binding-like beta-propeller repeat protein [Planctomycetaceae bacterium]